MQLSLGTCPGVFAVSWAKDKGPHGSLQSSPCPRGKHFYEVLKPRRPGLPCIPAACSSPALSLIVRLHFLSVQFCGWLFASTKPPGAFGTSAPMASADGHRWGGSDRLPGAGTREEAGLRCSLKRAGQAFPKWRVTFGGFRLENTQNA